MIEREFSVDLDKPLAFQVGHLGEAYDEWVHQPVVGKGSPRFFANDFIERFTKTQWWVVPVFWLPFVWWSVSYPTRHDVARRQIAATVVAGVVLWTFMEYSLHRFLFHIKTTSYWGNTIHYIFHGCHHKHPMDDLRLVLPPPVAAIFIFIFYNLTKLLIPSSPHAHALFGGELLGYVVYDCIHYYLHHGKPFKSALSLHLKIGDPMTTSAPHHDFVCLVTCNTTNIVCLVTLYVWSTGCHWITRSGSLNFVISYHSMKYHMNHHFRIQDKGFGVTTDFWDWVFGTLPSNYTKTLVK